MEVTTKCVVCKEFTQKYKCPTCVEPYCSVNCFKEHKKVECKAPEKPPEEPKEEPTIFTPFKTEDTVDPFKLEQLRHSEPLKNLLYNRHMRSVLHQIDTAPNAWNAMRVAMHEPLFTEFADECLKVVEPPTEEEQQDD